MDSQKVLELARTLDRAQFINVLKGAFLVATELRIESQTPFETSTPSHGGSPPPSQAEVISEMPKLSVFELVKSPGNPYTDRISVGRARNCDIVIRNSSVSKLHAHFHVIQNGSAYKIADCDSQNGTKVNGVRLRPNEPTTVASGDTLIFGHVSAYFVNSRALYDLLKQLDRR